MKYFYVRNRRKAFDWAKRTNPDGVVHIREIDGVTGECYRTLSRVKYQARFRAMLCRFDSGRFSNLWFEYTR